jgi:hypothetical protein
VTLERLVDGLHLEIAERDRAGAAGGDYAVPICMLAA